MLEFAFTAEDLARTSLALSPLWELVCSLRVLQNPQRDAAHREWAEEALARVGHLAELPLLFAIAPRGHYLPDFLTPPPDTALPDLRSELDAMVSADPSTVRRDLDHAYPEGLPDLLRPIARHPKAGLRRVAEALLAYWEVALEASWPKLREVLLSDIAYRGREFAIGGPVRLFENLHPTVSWTGEKLVVDKTWALELSLDGAGMLLLPSAFAWPMILTITAPAFRPTLIYPARGAGALWASPQTASAIDSLARLMSGNRAAVLAALHEPASTTELAGRLSVTPGGVSKHLSVLRDAGLVWSSRTGRVVWYARTSLGDALCYAASER